MKSEKVDQIAKALVEAQKEIQPAEKKSINPFFESKYADLQSIWEACQEPLTKNGLAVSQTMEASTEGVTVTTTLLHASGQWIDGSLFLRPQKNDPQAIGKCISYARRYSLAAIVGVVTEDYDAEDAMDRKPEKPKIKQEQAHVDESTDMEKFLPLMADQLVRIGEDTFFRVLGNYGFTKPEEAVNRDIAQKIYKEMLSMEAKK